MATTDEQLVPDAVEQVMRLLGEALEASSSEDRHERVGRAVRTLTRLWSEMNPDFDGDAWYPVSAMLTEHWDQIRQHMAAADLD